MDLSIMGAFYTINRYCEYYIRILCIWLYIGTWLKDIFWDFFEKIQRCPRSVNNFRTNYSFDILGDLCGPKWSRRRRRRRHPLSVRPSVPSSVPSSVVRRPSSIVVRLNITCKTSLKHPSDGHRSSNLGHRSGRQQRGRKQNGQTKM